MTNNGHPTARCLLARGTSALSSTFVPEPKFQAELLLRHALGFSREALLSRLDQPVSVDAFHYFNELLASRQRRVPTQYLLGKQEFYGLIFRVTPAVLIPRPETETLVEETIAELQTISQPKIIDIGCGSGCISVAIAASRPDARIVAIDKSVAALDIAKENAIRHKVDNQIIFLESNLLDKNKMSEVDAVVTNPPYIADNEFPLLQPEGAEHEPRLALSGGSNGLEIIETLLPQVSKALKLDGTLLMEIGQGQQEAVARLVAKSGLTHVRTKQDLSGNPRVVIAQNK